jgi:NADH-quinone oxidoreductase subunit N
MSPVNYAQLWQLALPQVIVVVAALIALAVDLLFLRARPLTTRFTVAALLGSLGCVLAIARIVLTPARANVLDGTLLANPLTQLVQIALLVLAIVTLLMATNSRFTNHVGEFVLLILVATVGSMFLVSSQDLLVIFISLELLSLSLYILTAFDKHRPHSSEAALKYFLFGGMSAAFLLFGFSLLYGLSNSTSLPRIADAIHASAGSPLNPLLLIAIVTTVIGFGFKVAAFPFHFWAPDVYQGAPAPSAAFIASSSKVASFFIFFQVLAVGFAGAEGSAAWMQFNAGWVPVVAVVAALSMVLGNLVAIVQRSVRRLLAYSAIAHAGYILLAIVAHTQQSLGALLYYVITYALATLGAFGVVAIVEQQTGGDRLAHFDGLSRRAPVLSACMFVFLLSLAGIPPLAGFFGKFYLFVSVLHSGPGLLWLVVLAVAMSAVSLYYYLQVLKRIYVANPSDGVPNASADASTIRTPILSQAVVVLLAAGVVLFGCAPHLLLQWIDAAIRATGF